LRDLPDGALLPDRSTILTLQSTVSLGSFGLALTAVDRRTGQTLRSLPLNGSWNFRYSMAGPGVLSPNGRWIALVGSAMNTVDSAGKWTAHSEFAVVDTALTSAPRSVILDGDAGYFLDAISDDGRSLYLVQNRMSSAPGSSRPAVTDSKLRVYDLDKDALVDLSGEAARQWGSYVTDPVAIGDALYRVSADPSTLSLQRVDLNARTARILRLETVSPPSGLPSDVPPGELSMLWSVVGTRDGRTAYVVNGALGLVHEIDAATFTLRRTGKVSISEEDPASAGTPLSARTSVASLLARLSQWIAPIADAKMQVHAGAVLSGDERTLYAVTADGLRAVDLETLSWRTFVPRGRFMDLALSPDGKRVYALNADGRWMAAFDARTGALLGQLDVGGYPQAIVAIDPS
jgi:hypothetical protein